MNDFPQPLGELPGLPPNFWRSYVTPRIVECAWTYHSRGTGYAADNCPPLGGTA